jgi:predicted RNA binding protein YcfA (HicA-like mRNA interferase family)
MTERLRLCSGSEAVQKFKRAGWTVARQRGSHIMMVNMGMNIRSLFPNTMN